MVQFELTPTESQQGICTPLAHKTKPVLKTSQFRLHIWSLATQKNASKALRGLSPFSLLPRDTSARRESSRNVNISSHLAAPCRISERMGVFLTQRIHSCATSQIYNCNKRLDGEKKFCWFLF